MHDPRSPEILAWLDTLSLRKRLATMHALMFAFPPLRRDWQWKMRMPAVHAELKPSADELGEILIEAGRISERLKLALAA
jgi:hypothetical protein